MSCLGRDVRVRSATRIDPATNPATNTVAAFATVPRSHGGTVAMIDGEASAQINVAVDVDVSLLV